MQPPHSSTVPCAAITGLAGASTDHTSICFDVDRTSGVIGQGISNQHWYKLGLQHVGRVDASASTTYTHHPDTGKAIAGGLPWARLAVHAVQQASHAPGWMAAGIAAPHVWVSAATSSFLFVTTCAR
jgi:hypothetical protein